MLPGPGRGIRHALLPSYTTPLKGAMEKSNSATERCAVEDFLVALTHPLAKCVNAFMGNHGKASPCIPTVYLTLIWVLGKQGHFRPINSAEFPVPCSIRSSSVSISPPGDV